MEIEIIGDLKVGTKVLVYKNNWYDGVKKSGILKEIFKIDNKIAYRVDFYKDNRWDSGCNIFTHQGETIELDIENTRDCKLRELGL